MQPLPRKPRPGPVCLPHIALCPVQQLLSLPLLQREGETLAGVCVGEPPHPVRLQMYSTWHNYHLLSV